MKELTSFKMVNFIVFSQCMFCSPSWRCLYHVERQINNHSLIPSTQPRPQGFSLKKWVAHPFFKGKALGMRLTVNWRDTNHFDSEDDYRTGCRNVSHCQQQQSYSGLRSPGRSYSTYLWNEFLGVQTQATKVGGKCSHHCTSLAPQTLHTRQFPRLASATKAREIWLAHLVV